MQRTTGRRWLAWICIDARTVMVRMTPAGEQLEQVRFMNSRAELTAQIAKAGSAPAVVLEATMAGTGQSTR